MVFRKTNSKDRVTYKYVSKNPETGSTMVTVLRAGENGVTELDIKLLHSEDDKEVYNNIKNSKPKISKEYQRQIKEWREKHPYDDIKSEWNVSIDAANDIGIDSDKSNLLYKVATVDVYFENDGFYALIEHLTEKQKRVMELHFKDGYNWSEISKILSCSVKNVCKLRDKALENIKKKK